MSPSRSQTYTPEARSRREDRPMLSLMLTYHDTLYLATELGALALVLALCWLLPKPQHHHPH